jgi:phosphoglycolate phosphatase
MPAAAIRAILFDKDGTLFDFHGTWMPGYRAIAADLAGGDAALAARMLAATGLDPETGRLDPSSALAAGTNQEIAALWSAVADLGAADAITARLDSWFGAPGAVVPVPVTDLPALLGRLKGRGLRLGVATMDSHAAAVRAANDFAFHHHLDFIAGYDSGHGHKPGPGMVKAFCGAVGIEAGAVAVVGDTPHDMGMARSAGAGLAIGVLTGACPRFELEALADQIIENIADLELALGLD